MWDWSSKKKKGKAKAESPSRMFLSRKGLDGLNNETDIPKQIDNLGKKENFFGTAFGGEKAQNEISAVKDSFQDNALFNRETGQRTENEQLPDADQPQKINFKDNLPVRFSVEEPPKDVNFWIDRFNQMYFPGMDLIEATVHNPLSHSSEEKDLYVQTRREFLQYLYFDYKNDLRSAGFDEESILILKKGWITENYQIHMKIPAEYGGKIEFDNLILIQSIPYHRDIHLYLNEQTAMLPQGTLPSKLYIPLPKGKVFIPPSNFTGSGGKGKHDRSVFAGYSAEAFKRISIKTMPGR